MLIDANQLIGWVVSPLLAAIVGGLVVYVKGVVKRGNDHDKAMEQGMRALLRQQLIDYHRDYVVSGHACPVRVKEQATSVYAAYHDLGGNGTGTKLYQEIMNTHVEED